MTMKERLKVHREIERENRRKLKEWKEGGAHDGTEKTEVKKGA